MVPCLIFGTGILQLNHGCVQQTTDRCLMASITLPVILREVENVY